MFHPLFDFTTVISGLFTKGDLYGNNYAISITTNVLATLPMHVQLANNVQMDGVFLTERKLHNVADFPFL